MQLWAKISYVKIITVTQNVGKASNIESKRTQLFLELRFFWAHTNRLSDDNRRQPFIYSYVMFDNLEK